MEGDLIMHFGGKFLSALILATNVTWPVAAEQLLERTFAKLSYEGSQTRDYYVFVPDGLTGSERVPWSWCCTAASRRPKT
jgi:hypothetical protein